MLTSLMSTHMPARLLSGRGGSAQVLWFMSVQTVIPCRPMRCRKCLGMSSTILQPGDLGTDPYHTHCKFTLWIYWKRLVLFQHASPNLCITFRCFNTPKVPLLNSIFPHPSWLQRLWLLEQPDNELGDDCIILFFEWNQPQTTTSLWLTDSFPRHLD